MLSEQSSDRPQSRRARVSGRRAAEPARDLISSLITNPQAGGVERGDDAG